MGRVAWSGDPALQEMAEHITLFIVCCKAKARGTMRTSSPTNHLQRLSQSAKFHPGGMRASRPAATFIVQHILHNQHPPPKIPNFSFLIFVPPSPPPPPSSTPPSYFLTPKAIPHNSKCRYGERGAADAKPKAQIILDAAKVSAASGGNSEPKQGQRSQSARGFCPRSTMRVPQPDIIEHFGNADAVPQLPERCLSR